MFWLVGLVVFKYVYIDMHCMERVWPLTVLNLASFSLSECIVLYFSKGCCLIGLVCSPLEEE